MLLHWRVLSSMICHQFSNFLLISCCRGFLFEKNVTCCIRFIGVPLHHFFLPFVIFLFMPGFIPLFLGWFCSPFPASDLVPNFIVLMPCDFCQQVASHNIPYRHRSLEPRGTGLRHSSVIWSAHNTSFRQVIANHRGKKRHTSPALHWFSWATPCGTKIRGTKWRCELSNTPWLAGFLFFRFSGFTPYWRKLRGKPTTCRKMGSPKVSWCWTKKLSPGVLAYNKDMQDWLVSVHQGIHVLPGTPNDHFLMDVW